MLFEINSKSKALQGEAMKESSQSRFISETINNELSASIGNLKMGEEIHFDTVNKWSLHDIIIYCLQATGPANLYLSTWSIKEYPARLLTRLKSEGNIKEMHALLDYRIKVNSPEAFQLIEKNADSFNLIRCHAKITVIQNKNWGVTIVGSANLTTNTRAECGIITCNYKVADFRKNWILKNISK